MDRWGGSGNQSGSFMSIDRSSEFRAFCGCQVVLTVSCGEAILRSEEQLEAVLGTVLSVSSLS